MALFDQSYTPPGVYTTTVINANGPSLQQNVRVPVFIGEGTETFTELNVELHRGSSATADDQVVQENLSDQVNGTTRVFQLHYFPVVSGNGSGTVTNDPTKVQVTSTDLDGNTVPVTLVALNGATGQITTQTLVPVGTSLSANYYFKKTDTLISNESLLPQVPTFAQFAVNAPVAGALTLSVSNPGYLGNNVSLAFTQAASGSGVSDAMAVTGAGTDAISIELLSPDNTVRTIGDLVNLVNAGIPTASGGYLTVVYFSSANENSAASPAAAAHFAGGSGQSTATVFKVANVPIVDGTNAGAVTTNPADVTVLVNGSQVPVAAVDGAHGLVTLSNYVPSTASSFTITYYTNTYQDTSDALPSQGVASISFVGLGPNRSDFVQGVDYVLSGNSIAWGATATTAVGRSTPGYAVFDGSDVNLTLVDEKVYLRPVSGAVSGSNAVFTLEDTPVDGSGLGRPTDNPALVSVYVGPNPVAALAAGPVKVSRLSGASATVTLFNAPSSGQNVYATYWRSTLNDHVFTLSVAVPGLPGAGTFLIADELGQAAPLAKPGVSAVANSAFADTGLVFPNNFPDLAAALGGADETVTLTFQNDGLSNVVTPATQATLTVSDQTPTPKIVFRATNPGAAGNAVTIALIGGVSGQPDASAISVSGSAVTVETLKADNTTTRSWQDIVNLFETYPATVAGAGQILCSGVQGADLTSQAASLAATHLAGGADAVAVSYANRFLVTTSRTAQQAAADGLGLTGGATTGGSGTGASGYLGQTYIDPVTDLKFTVVDPASALNYGYTQLPSPSYSFSPGDTLSFVVSRESGHPTGSVPTIAIPGLRTQVVTTVGMQVGDSVTVATFNRAGNPPPVGSYYYVTYTNAKQPADYGLKIFSSVDDAYYNYGQPNNTANRLSLAVYLASLNGAGPFGCVQVPSQPNGGLGTDQAFIDAIAGLNKALPGSSGNQKPNVIVPLSTSATVQQYLSRFLTTQAAPRNKGEAMGFVGFAQFTTANQARAAAASLANARVIAVDPAPRGIMLQGSTDTVALEYAVDSVFAAAALAGLMLNPANDVATTLTNQQVVGFSRNLVVYDDPTMDLMATSGITVLTDDNGALNVRHYKSTDPSNAITSEPYCTTTADFIAQTYRRQLKQFIGRKMTADLPNTIAAVANSLQTGWLNNLISATNPVVVTQDPDDPTTLDVAVSYRPLFSLLWIYVTFTVNLTQ